MASWRDTYIEYFDSLTGKPFMKDYGMEVLDDQGERLFFLTNQWDHHIDMKTVAISIVEQLNEREESE
jgi:hypothetical protein